LLHSLSPALIREMAMSSGYGAASLTERIYGWSASPQRDAAAGLPICTTASDSEGTLGGLVALAPVVRRSPQQVIEMGMSTFSPSGKISLTAVAIAHFRALESSRDDRLFDDSLAAPLVAASGLSMSQISLSDVVAGRVYESVAARTRYLDERIVGAVDGGCMQVVILAAGLDTRAFRLKVPTDTRYFELDLQELVLFKESALVHEGAVSVCERVAVSADLLTNWTAVLRDAGFDPETPTVWVAEGLFMYFTDDQSESLLAEISSVSAPGSHLCFVHFGPGALKEEQSRELAERVKTGGFSFESYLADPVIWCQRYGWQGDFDTIKSFASTLGRVIPYEEDSDSPVTWLGDVTYG
jgi:methyltransferase (TIGR00027 family)